VGSGRAAAQQASKNYADGQDSAVESDDEGDEDFAMKPADEEPDEDDDFDDDWLLGLSGTKRKRHKKKRNRAEEVARAKSNKVPVEEVWTLDALLETIPSEQSADKFSHPPGFKLQRVSRIGRAGRLASVTNAYRPETKEDQEQDDDEDVDDVDDEEEEATSGVVFKDRLALETQYFEALDAELFPNSPYLGRVVGGKWEIRPQHAQLALAHVLGTLVASGHVVEIAGEPMPTFLAAHLYEKSVPPEREKKPRGIHARPRQPVFFQDRPKSDYELQREQRIAQNDAMLKQLGLAS